MIKNEILYFWCLYKNEAVPIMAQYLSTEPWGTYVNFFPPLEGPHGEETGSLKTNFAVQAYEHIFTRNYIIEKNENN